MQKGDMDNGLAPAIVIDVDELVIVVNDNLLGRARKFISKIMPKRVKASVDVASYMVDSRIYSILEYFFRSGVAVYLFAHRDKIYKECLADFLEVNMLYYNKLIVGGEREREKLLKRSEVHWYFYKHPSHASTSCRHKERMVGGCYDISL